MIFVRKRFITQDGLREVIAVLPEGEQDSMEKSPLITIVSEKTGEDAARELLQRFDLTRLIETEKLIVYFPQCRDGLWEISESASLSPDEKFLQALPMQGMAFGPRRPSLDICHLVGTGSGADLVCSLSLKAPSSISAATICAIGGQGRLPSEGIIPSATPAILVDMPQTVADLFCEMNKTDSREGNRFFRSCNPCQAVTVTDSAGFDPKSLWTALCSTVRRMNGAPEGLIVDRCYRLPEDAVYRRNVVLRDGLSHDWVEVLPPSVLLGDPKKVPLILISHGMGGNPVDTADQFGMHLIGKREGFITVYVFSSNHRGWNLNYAPGQPDDVAYYAALIDYLKAQYPVDESRIYTTGFSNGAGMAMLFALEHPEIVAAACPVDSTFPYAASGRFRLPSRPEPYMKPEDAGEAPGFGGPPPMDRDAALAPLHRSLAAQKNRETPLRLPVMYFYGTRETEYPIRSGSNQELSMNFWKEFNGIPTAPIDDTLSGNDAVGVLGMKIRELHPDARYPEHCYTEHVFFNDEGLDAYHFMLMHGKAHDVHPIEAELGWRFVSRFSRDPDGTLHDAEAERV